MKTIIVPTDFSASAEKAMIFAGHLAKTVDAGLMLLHIYQIPVGMNDMPVLMISAEELKNNADAGLDRAAELLQQNCGDLPIATESRMGDVVTELNDVCEQQKPFMVVVGKHGASGMERMLFGSTSRAIIRHSSYPVLVVPDAVAASAIRNAALAVDASVSGSTVSAVRALAAELHAKLSMVHVKPEKGSVAEVDGLAAELGAGVTTIFDHEFSRGIETFVRQHHIDLLIVLPRRHSLIERLFFKTHTSELLQKLNIPVLCVSDVD